MKRLAIFFLAILGSIHYSTILAQFEITGQYKSRTAFSHGYKQPLLTNEKPNFFITQRARLGGVFNHDKFQLRIVAQDVRVWGNTSHLAVDYKGSLSIFEANASLFLSPKWTVKLGRQPLVYDNHRIFGSLDWAMQARRHDAALIKFRDSTWSLDVGATYNQQQPSNTHILYELNNYKTFQFAWFNKKWSNWSVSLLALNNGIEQTYIEDSIKKGRTNFSQTFGSQINFEQNKVSLEGFGYYQMGKTGLNQQLSAYNASVTASYKIKKKWQLALGGEILSGTSQAADSSFVNRSFGAYYGTSHKFNGFMDYFNRTANNNHTGLIDAYFKTGLKVKKFNIGLDHHLLYSAAPIKAKTIPQNPVFMAADPFLGYEVDLTIKYQLAEEVIIQAGYSQLFGTSTMHQLKGGKDNSINNWAYLMVTVRPFKNFQMNSEKSKIINKSR